MDRSGETKRPTRSSKPSTASSQQSNERLKGSDQPTTSSPCSTLLPENSGSLPPTESSEEPRFLTLTGVGTLTCEDAFGLGAHVGGLSLGLDAYNQARGRKNSLDSQATFHFFRDPDPLSEVLAQLVRSKGALLLDQLSKLTVEGAGILATHAGALSLKSLFEASDAVVEALAKHKGHLSLRAPKFFSDRAAVALAAHEGGLSLWCVLATRQGISGV
jgi:hypothetical protein